MKRFSRSDILFLLFASLAAVVMLAGFISMNYAVGRALGRGGDFLLPWKATRALLVDKAEPYGGPVANAVQHMVYGRNAAPGEKPYIAELPLHILLLYSPVALLEDSNLARAIDLFVSEAALLALIFMSLRLTDWQPRRLFRISFYVLSALSFYSLWSLTEGSPAILLGVLYAGMLLALRDGLDELVGALAALALARWEVGGLFIFLVLMRVVQQKRWRVLWGFLMALSVLVAIAFFVDPGWVVPFLRANLANWRWDYGFSPGAVLEQYWPRYGSWAGWALTALLSVLLLAEWSGARRAEFRRFYWVACLTLAVTPLTGVRAQTQDLVVLLIPLAFIFAIVRERWKAGYWLSGALLLLVAGLPWALLLAIPLEPALRDQLIFLFLPVFCVAGLYWIRWWAIRPARTWLERITQPEYR